jgi:predicted HicB family RNase H-like nuclease
LTDEEIAALEVAANKAGMSMNKFVELKLEESLRDGTFEKVVEEYKKKCS